jgi:hypothetical protein
LVLKRLVQLHSHVRYADDLVVGFENRMEAERFLKAFRERLAKFGLELHPEKTRLIEFGRFAAQDREKRGVGKPETFTFLGFTHHCGKRRSNGSFIVWRKTAKKRMVAKLHAIKAELRLRMHEPVAVVGAWLRKVVKRLLPLPCGPGKHRPVECLRATLATIVAAHSTPSQSTTNVVEPDNPDLQAVDSSPTRFASLSYRSLSRHSSKVGAVCVEAPVRFCAGGDQRWSSLPQRVHEQCKTKLSRRFKIECLLPTLWHYTLDPSRCIKLGASFAIRLLKGTLPTISSPASWQTCVIGLKTNDRSNT